MSDTEFILCVTFVTLMICAPIAVFGFELKSLEKRNEAARQFKADKERAEAARYEEGTLR